MSKKKSYPPKPHSIPLLTETELTLMNIVWKLGSARVQEVLAELPDDRPMAYTSASTLLRILVKKGILLPKSEGKGHRYLPIFSKQDYEKRSLEHLLDTLFERPSQLIASLLGSGKISPEEMKKIENLVNTR